MKKTIITVILSVLACMGAKGQSTNPLNYSGRMYVEAIEVISTPRYISYEDHAILTRKMRIPSVDISKIDMDFEKGLVTIGGKEFGIKVSATRKYDTDRGWVVVVYSVFEESGDKAELVWPEFGKPFFQQITPGEGEVNIARMVLSRNPVVASEEEALMNLLQGLGTM